MPKHEFTVEEMQELANNPNTSYVSRHVIRFTLEFRSKNLIETRIQHVIHRMYSSILRLSATVDNGSSVLSIRQTFCDGLLSLQNILCKAVIQVDFER